MLNPDPEIFSIRKAMPTDADVIAGFQMEMALETEHLKLDAAKLRQGVEAVFSNPERGQYYVAEKNGVIVASLLITFEWSDWRNLSIWWIQSVYVMPGFRKSGCFSALYNFIKGWVENDPGVGGLRLYVDRRNESAIQVYRKLKMDDSHYQMFEWMK